MNGATISQGYWYDFIPGYIVLIPCILLAVFLFRKRIWKTKEGRSTQLKLGFGIAFLTAGVIFLMLCRKIYVFHFGFTITAFGECDRFFWKQFSVWASVGFIVLGVVQILRFQLSWDDRVESSPKDEY